MSKEEELRFRAEIIKEQKAEIERLREELEAERLWIKEGRKLHEVQKTEIGRLQREKAARVYYQNIVYATCTTLDAIEGRSIRHGKGLVCGTLETPSTEVQEAMLRTKAEIGRLKEEVKWQKQNVQYRDDIIGLSPKGDRHAHLVAEIERLRGDEKHWRECFNRTLDRETDKADEIERLRAIVDKLPKTADGIYVTSPFQTLWRWSNHKPPRLCQVTLYNLGWQKGKDCYSTREAAEASANRNT